MQTFLPIADFKKSLQCLDYRRLGKQRVEARQILTALEAKGSWYNHPAARMWEGYENALVLYSNLAIKEWISRGYNNTMEIISFTNIEYPWWFGNEEFHSSHRSKLLEKDYDFYSQFNWEEEPGKEYVWPS